MGLEKNINIVREVALTDLKVRYQGSFLGYLWTLMKPLMLFAVMYVVFTKFLRIGGKIPHYAIYLLFGIVIWAFFAEVTSVCMSSIVNKGELIRKVYFPRILLVIANSMTSLIVFSLNLVVVFVFLLGNKLVPTPMSLALFSLLLIELYVLSLGIGLLLSALYVKFRDIAPIWEVFLQAMFYATPILYPLTMVPAPYNKLISLSPVAQIIQDSRYLLISHETIRTIDILGKPLGYIPYLLPFVIFVVGYFTFSKMSANFAEQI